LSATYHLEKNYEIDGDVIYSHHLFKDINSSFEVASFNKRHQLQLSFHKLKRIFGAHDIEISSTYPSSAFVKASIYDKSEILMALYDAFYDAYPGMIINNLSIAPISYFDQGEAQLQPIKIPKSLLLRREGTFRIAYMLPSHRKRQLSLRYKIDAELDVVKTSIDLTNNSPITSENSYTTRIDFVNFRNFPLATHKTQNVRTKHYLRKESILTHSMIKPLATINKYDKVRVLVIQNGVKIEFYATAQNEAQKGAIVKVKTSDNRILDVRVIDKGVCELE
jgi:flagella basal body P-ring formation protein FlgA